MLWKGVSVRNSLLNTAKNEEICATYLRPLEVTFTAVQYNASRQERFLLH